MTDDEPIDTLLVEDDPGDAALTREAFDEDSIKSTLHTVSDGITALDFLHQRGDYVDAPRPQLVLLDLNLPRKGAWTFSKTSKRIPISSTYPSSY